MVRALAGSTSPEARVPVPAPGACRIIWRDRQPLCIQSRPASSEGTDEVIGSGISPETGFVRSETSWNSRATVLTRTRREARYALYMEGQLTETLAVERVVAPLAGMARASGRGLSSHAGLYPHVCARPFI